MGASVDLSYCVCGAILSESGNVSSVKGDLTMSPKEWVKRDLMDRHGLLADQADEFWHRLQDYALSQLREQTASTAPYPALVFDGCDGIVLPFYLSVCDETQWKDESSSGRAIGT